MTALKGTTSHVREMIKTEKLINRLQNSILDPDSEPLNQTQVSAIKVLLGKAIPDLRAIEHTGNVDGEVVHRHKVIFK